MEYSFLDNYLRTSFGFDVYIKISQKQQLRGISYCIMLYCILTYYIVNLFNLCAGLQYKRVRM